MRSSQFLVPGSQKNLTILRWLKFNLVGGFGIGLQLAVLAVLHSWFHLDYLLATVSAVEATVIHNFLWHERFTWADRPAKCWTQSLVRLLCFNATNGAVSILGNILLMRWLVGTLKFNYLASNVFAIAVCSLVNFGLSDNFVFPRQDRGLPDEGVTLAR